MNLVPLGDLCLVKCLVFAPPYKLPHTKIIAELKHGELIWQRGRRHPKHTTPNSNPVTLSWEQALLNAVGLTAKYTCRGLGCHFPCALTTEDLLLEGEQCLSGGGNHQQLPALANCFSSGWENRERVRQLMAVSVERIVPAPSDPVSFDAHQMKKLWWRVG